MRGLVDAVAARLADPGMAPSVLQTHRQHLAYGPPGIALLHIERAANGLGPWQHAHGWLAAASHGSLTSGPDSHPFYGVPAFAHAFACAADHLPGSYQRALDAMDRQIEIDVRRRLDAAHRRIDAGCLPQLAEFDTIRGLTGYGAYLLRRRKPGSPTVRAILDYCVRLTEPIRHSGEDLPGWWTATGPSGSPDERFPGGHGNTGMAHGIGGMLALLALAARKGTATDGQHGALRTILTWLDRWQEETGRGSTWPYWITRSELRTGRRAGSKLRRPSWCYGTAGLARAQQLAALAIGDTERQITAENALVAALTDPDQLGATTDHGLCHGFAGLTHIAVRTAADAHPSTVGRLRAAIPGLLAAICPVDNDLERAATACVSGSGAGLGLLDGAAGTALALLAADTAAPPRSAWDACLLIA
ncbi:lanthionine synthetase C family protein [Streptomyces anulatus]